MSHPSVISGVVRDAAGRPVAGARVYFTAGPVPLPEIAALTDGRGRFSLTAPVDGVYRIECAADGYQTAAVSVEIKGGQGQQVEIQLRV